MLAPDSGREQLTSAELTSAELTSVELTSVNRSCPRCAAEFASPHKLARHLARKRPCDPIVGAPAGANDCPGCGRRYSRVDSMRRHAKTCAVARGGDASTILRLQHELAQLRATASWRIDDSIVSADLRQSAEAGPVSFNESFETRPEHIIRAFDSNVALDRYATLTGDRRAGGAALLFAVELIMNLIRARHENLAFKNISRSAGADTVLVWDGARWTELAIDTAICALFDAVVQSVAQVLAGASRSLLPNDIAAAADLLPAIYAERAGEVQARGRADILDHLERQRPQFGLASRVVTAARAVAL